MNKELLKKLTQAYGPSGHEQGIATMITEEIKSYVDEIKVDVMGNLIAIKKGTGKKIMVAGHMDEIAVMVTNIDDKGFLRITNIGGVGATSALYQRVSFENGTFGVIGSDRLDSPKDLEMKKLFIDIGAKNKAEASALVSIGDVAVFTAPFESNDNIIMTKALDDRLGCYVAIEAAKQLSKTENEVYFTFTVQEEVGLRGAKTSAFNINPDLAIAIDVTLTGDTPNCNPMAMNIGDGVAIKVKDGSMITAPSVKKLMIDTCKENNIPYQLEVLEGAGTDAGAIHITRGGILSGCISIPTRYVHSPAETVSIADVDHAVMLLVKLLEK